MQYGTSDRGIFKARVFVAAHAYIKCGYFWTQLSLNKYFGAQGQKKTERKFVGIERTRKLNQLQN